MAMMQIESPNKSVLHIFDAENESNFRISLASVYPTQLKYSCIQVDFFQKKFYLFEFYDEQQIKF